MSAAEAAAEAAYQQRRKEGLIIAAGALVLADTIGAGLRAGELVTDGAAARITGAFNLAEAFMTEAERRVGKLPL